MKPLAKPNAESSGEPRGRPFVKGNPGGPGNPAGATIEQLRHVFVAQCTPERMARIADRMLDSAEKGDVQACKEILNRVLGAATQQVKVEEVKPSGPTDAQVVAIYLRYDIAKDKWVPGLRRLYEAGMIEGIKKLK